MFIQRLIVTITVVETTTITVTQTGETYEDHTIDLAYHHDGHHADDGGLRRRQASEAPAAQPTTVAAQPTTAAAPAQPAPEMCRRRTSRRRKRLTAAVDASACEEYFGFCITAQATGAVDATGAGGWASSSNTDCTALAAAGDARILELPNLLAAGEQQIAVALTRIGRHTYRPRHVLGWLPRLRAGPCPTNSPRCG